MVASGPCLHDSSYVPATGKGYVDASTVDAETAKRISKVRFWTPQLLLELLAAVALLCHSALGFAWPPGLESINKKNQIRIEK